MMTMLDCAEENCACIHHMLVHCLEKGLNVKAKMFIEDLKNVSQLTDTEGYTLLHFAAEYGNAEMTQYLIEQGCEVNAQSDRGQTPLMMAVYSGHLETSETLTKNHADIYLTVLTESGVLSSLEMAFYSCFDRAMSIPARQAWRRHIILDMLVDKVNEAFYEGRLTQILVNASDEVKLIAVVFGNAEVIKFTLDNNYPMEFRERRYGCTALHCAVMMARLESAKILIERGADVGALNYSDGKTPLSYYTQSLSMADADDNSEILKMLLKYSTSLSVPNGITSFSDIETVLQFGSEKTLKVILQSDIDLESGLLHDRSVLDIIARNHKIDNIDFLDTLDIDFDVNEARRDGETPLMLAAEFGHPRKVDFLLRHGADINAISSFGWSALVYAIIASEEPEKESVLTRIVELLLQHGAEVYQSRRHIFGNDHVKSSRATDYICLPMKVFLAHLAMNEVLANQSPTDPNSEKNQSNPRFRCLTTHFNLCKKQLDEMKNLKICGTITLFKLLTDREDKLIAYARNRELASAMSEAIQNLGDYESYYVHTLQSRVSRVLEIAKLQEQAARAIETLTGLRANAHHVIVYEIISYLHPQDLRGLCQIKSISR